MEPGTYSDTIRTGLIQTCDLKEEVAHDLAKFFVTYQRVSGSNLSKLEIMELRDPPVSSGFVFIQKLPSKRKIVDLQLSFPCDLDSTHREYVQLSTLVEHNFDLVNVRKAGHLKVLNRKRLKGYTVVGEKDREIPYIPTPDQEFTHMDTVTYNDQREFDIEVCDSSDDEDANTITFNELASDIDVVCDSSDDEDEACAQRDNITVMLNESRASDIEVVCDSSDDEASDDRADKRRKLCDGQNVIQPLVIPADLPQLNFGKGLLKANCVLCGMRGIPSRRSKEHPANTCKKCFEEKKHQHDRITEPDHEKGYRNRPCKMCGEYKISCRIAKEQPCDTCSRCFQKSEEYDVRFVKTWKPTSKLGRKPTCMLCGKDGLQHGIRICATCKCPEVKVEEDLVAYSAMETLLKLSANEDVPEKTLPWLNDDGGFTPVVTFDFEVPYSISTNESLDKFSGLSFDLHTKPNTLIQFHIRDIDRSEHTGTLSWLNAQRELPDVPLDILLMCTHLSTMQSRIGGVGEQIAKIHKLDRVNVQSEMISQPILLHNFPDQRKAGSFGIQPIFTEQEHVYVKIGDSLSITEAHLKKLDEAVVADEDLFFDKEQTNLKDWLVSIEMKKLLHKSLNIKMIALLSDVAVLAFEYMYFARGSINPSIGTGHTSIKLDDFLKYMEKHRYFQFVSEEYNKSTGKTKINELFAGQVEKSYLPYLRSTRDYEKVLL